MPQPPVRMQQMMQPMHYQPMQQQQMRMQPMPMSQQAPAPMQQSVFHPCQGFQGDQCSQHQGFQPVPGHMVQPGSATPTPERRPEQPLQPQPFSIAEHQDKEDEEEHSKFAEKEGEPLRDITPGGVSGGDSAGAAEPPTDVVPAEIIASASLASLPRLETSPKEVQQGAHQGAELHFISS